MDDKQIHRIMDLLTYSPNTIGGQRMVDSYSIHNGKVDVIGDVTIPHGYSTIPVPFRSVSGTFAIHSFQVTSLHNSPIEVGGGFFCSQSNISSLKYAPREVGQSFSCISTNITSLEHSPREVGETFECSYTNITSLKGCPQFIEGLFCTSHTELENLKHGPVEIGGSLICSGVFKDEPIGLEDVNAKGGVVWR